MELNKNVSVWRGSETPPTDYHIWEKEDGSLYTKIDGEWISIVSPTDKTTLEKEISKIDSEAVKRSAIATTRQNEATDDTIYSAKLSESIVKSLSADINTAAGNVQGTLQPLINAKLDSSAVKSVKSESSFDVYSATYINTNMQPKLTPGNNISIDGDTISCTIDTVLYKLVDTLPTTGDESKIYLVSSTEQETNNVYKEYIWKNDAWEQLGEYKSEVDLTPYFKTANIDLNVVTDSTSKVPSGHAVYNIIDQLPFIYGIVKGHYSSETEIPSGSADGVYLVDKTEATTGSWLITVSNGSVIAASANKGNYPKAKYVTPDGSIYQAAGTKAWNLLGKLQTSDENYTTAEKTKLAGIAEKANNYSLPTASSSTLGGIKVGDGLIIDNGVLALKDNALSTVIYFTQQAPSSIASTYVGVYHVLSNTNIAGTVTNKSNMAFYSNGTAVNELTIATGRIFTCMDGSKYQATDTGWSLLADSMDVVQETGTSTTNVMSQNAVTVALNNVAIENQWYGIEFDTTVSDPTCTRIGGNMDLHRTLPVQSKMKRCLLSDAGVVQAYLDANDSTLLANGQPADLTGAMGQVMVEMEGYVKYETEGNKRRVKMSQFALDGYSYFHYFISAYKATVQRSTLKLASVMNTTEDYRGGDNNAGWDGTYRSFLGLPANSISLTNFRTYARNRGTAGRSGAGWNCLVYDVYKTLYWSFIVEYATLNCQKAINSALTSEGYRQGGLGIGLTTAYSSWSQWTTYNSNQSTCPCGYTNSLGNNTGEIIYDKSEYESSWSKTAVINSYRGVECPYGDIWNWMDGVLVNVQSTDAGGTSKVYVCHDPALFSSTSFENYEYIGEEARSNGYGKTHLFGSEGDMIAGTIGGGTNSYMCDYHYISIPSSGTSLRGLFFGGGLSYSSNAGFSYSHSAYAPSSALGGLGSRLCFLP